MAVSYTFSLAYSSLDSTKLSCLTEVTLTPISSIMFCFKLHNHKSKYQNSTTKLAYLVTRNLPEFFKNEYVYDSIYSSTT